MGKRPNFPETKERRAKRFAWSPVERRVVAKRPPDQQTPEVSTIDWHRKTRRSPRKLAEKRTEADARRDEHLERTINNAPEDKKARSREPKTRRTTGVTVLAVHPVEEAARSNPLHF